MDHLLKVVFNLCKDKVTSVRQSAAPSLFYILKSLKDTPHFEKVLDQITSNFFNGENFTNKANYMMISSECLIED